MRSNSLISVRGAFLFFLAALGALLVGCDSTVPTRAPTPGAVTGTPSIVVPQTTPVEPGSPVPAVVPTIALHISSSASPSPALSEDARVDLYSAVVGALIKNEAALNVYVIPYVGKGEHLDDPDESLPLPASLLSTLQGRYSSVQFAMSGFADAVGALDDGGKVKNDGVLLTVGEISLSGAGGNSSATVKASIYRKAGDAEGYIYTLQRDSSGAWAVTKKSEEWNDK